MSPSKYWTEDKRFGLCFATEHQERIRKLCVEARSIETGGILMGIYSEDHLCAHVTEVLGPCADSKQDRFAFIRGFKGLNQILKDRWKKKGEFRIGEWHFHPGGSSVPSSVDNHQMKEFAKDANMKCPEPLLVILGGDPTGEWSISAYVYTASEGPLECISKIL